MTESLAGTLVSAGGHGATAAAGAWSEKPVSSWFWGPIPQRVPGEPCLPGLRSPSPSPLLWAPLPHKAPPQGLL